jgi:predicted anti-sigma-YlaC factor YlaD
MRWTRRHSRVRGTQRQSPPSGTASNPCGTWTSHCQTARAALSAALDNEREPELTAALHEHLSTCRHCQEWQEAAHKLTRRVRLTGVGPRPDRTERILDAVLRDSPRREQGRRLARGGLVAAAAGQLVIIVPALVLGQAGLDVPPHASRELGAFNLALSVGFLVAAARPARAKGMLALIGAATGALLLLSVVDSGLGQTTLPNEVPHLITLAGWVMLWLLTRTEPSSPSPPGSVEHSGTSPYPAFWRRILRRAHLALRASFSPVGRLRPGYRMTTQRRTPSTGGLATNPPADAHRGAAA